MKLPIPADWDGESWCRWSVCWPESEGWEGILRGFLTLPQRGWTWDERTGSILAVQQIGQEITALNLPLNGVFMACNDTELTQAFSDIALAIRYLADKQCCDNLQIDVRGGVQGSITQGSGEVIPIYGSVPPIGLEPGEIPPTYDDPAVYDADKCRMANQIIDGLTGTLTNLAGLGTFNAATLAVMIGLSMVGVIIFPPAMIPIAISVLLIVSGGLFVIAQLNAAIISDRDGWVCMFYEAEYTDEVMGVVATAVDVIIGGLSVSGRVAWALKTLVLTLLNSDTLNQLFAGGQVVGSTDVDCSGCGCDTLLEFQFETDLDGWQWVAESCDSIPSKAGSSVAWSAGHGGSMRMQKSAGGLDYVNAGISGLSGLIETGHRISLAGFAAAADAFLRIQIITDQNCFHIDSGAFPADVEGTKTTLLTDYVGQTLTGFTFGAGNSAGQPVDFYLESWAVDCSA